MSERDKLRDELLQEYLHSFEGMPKLLVKRLNWAHIDFKAGFDKGYENATVKHKLYEDYQTEIEELKAAQEKLVEAINNVQSLIGGLCNNSSTVMEPVRQAWNINAKALALATKGEQK